MKSRRFGMVEVNKTCLEENSDDMRVVFSLARFLPIQVSFDHVRDCFQYIGLSPEFDEVPVGQVCPVYKFRIHVDGEKGIVGVDVHKEGVSDGKESNKETSPTGL